MPTFLKNCVYDLENMAVFSGKPVDKDGNHDQWHRL